MQQHQEISEAAKVVQQAIVELYEANEQLRRWSRPEDVVRSPTFARSRSVLSVKLEDEMPVLRYGCLVGVAHGQRVLR